MTDRCIHCGVAQAAVLGTTKTHCVPPFEVRRHSFRNAETTGLPEQLLREEARELMRFYGNAFQDWQRDYLAAISRFAEKVGASSLDKQTKERIGREMLAAFDETMKDLTL